MQNFGAAMVTIERNVVVRFVVGDGIWLERRPTTALPVLTENC